MNRQSNNDSAGVPDFRERQGLQLGWRRNVFQLLFAIATALVGAVVGFLVTEGRPDLAALVGAVAGLVLGVFVSGFVLMLHDSPPLCTYFKPLPRNVTGERHLSLQRDRMDQVTGYPMLLLFAALLCMLIMDGVLVSGFVALVCLGTILVMVCAFRLRCPFCKKTLGQPGSRVTGIGRFCPQCGASFADVVE